jgi:hypothetical protein
MLSGVSDNGSSSVTGRFKSPGRIYRPIAVHSQFVEFIVVGEREAGDNCQILVTAQPGTTTRQYGRLTLTNSMKIRTNSADWGPLISHEGQITLAFLLSFVLFVSQVTSRSQDTSAASKASRPVTTQLPDWIIKTNKPDPSLTLLDVHLQAPGPSLENTSHSVNSGLSFTFEGQPGYRNLESLHMEIVDSKGARFRRGKSSSTNDSTFSYYFRSWPGEEQPFTLQVFSNSGDAASKTLVAEYFLENKLFQPKYTSVGVPLPFATNIGPATLVISSLYRVGAVGNGEYYEK